jgi:hypothetical protein
VTSIANSTASAATLPRGAEARSVLVWLAMEMRQDGSEARRKRSSFARSSIRVVRGRAS